LNARLGALGASAERLQGLVAGLSDADLVAQAYPAKWTVADVLSHIGSSAVIHHRHIDDGLAGRATPGDFAPSVWEEWNAKAPRAKADGALAADRHYLERIESLDDASCAWSTAASTRGTPHR